MKYNIPDSKALLEESLIEITQLSSEIKSMQEEITKMRGELEQSVRIMKAFQKNIIQVQKEIPSQVGHAAMQSFERELKKVQEIFQSLHNPGNKKKFWFLKGKKKGLNA